MEGDVGGRVTRGDPARHNPPVPQYPPMNDFKGNKQSLPRKSCAACGRTMVWRKAWARTWEAVRYCSDACRRNKRPADAGAR